MFDFDIPDQHHVSRYCNPSSLKADGTPSGVAFRLRSHKNERYLSVNWLEYAHSASRSEQLAKVRESFIEKGFGIASSAKFAVLNVGEIAAHVFEMSGHKICASHQLEDKDPSHSGLFGYTYSDEDDLIADLMAEKVIELYPARSQKK